MSMKSLNRSVAFVLLTSFFMLSHSFAAFTEQERLADFQQLVTVIQNNYAPLKWKKKTVKLDWKKHVEKYRKRVSEASSDESFYKELVLFLSGLKDAHIQVNVPSDRAATLGFLCDYIDGKVLLEQINKLKLPELLFPFAKGDQLLEIDGVPVAKLMKQLGQHSETGFKKSRDRIAAAFLTFRRQKYGMDMPQGISKVTILPKGGLEPVTVMLAWEHSGRGIIEVNDFFPTAFPIKPSLEESIAELSFNSQALSSDFVAELQKIGLSDLGSPKSMFTLPSNATQLQDIDFTAAIYEKDGKRIGVLRIPHYGDESVPQVIGKALLEMEEKTDVLVLDQTNNPGGMVSAVSSIASYFLPSSSPDVMFQLRSSRKWLQTIVDINKQIATRLVADPQDGAANSLKARFAYLEDMLLEGVQNRSFLSEPISLDLFGNLGMIQPNPLVRYTKPVLMLINELDFSGGDVLPAILKDNDRVVLFGQRTTGAGGNVAEYGPLTNSQFKFTLTESLIVRSNGDYIENLGVSPDLEYKVSETDFNEGYKDYVAAFTKAALDLLPKEEKPEANPNP